MAESYESNEVAVTVGDSGIGFWVRFMQKLIAKIVGTYFLILTGCGMVVVSTDDDKIVMQPGIAIIWGLAVMVLVTVHPKRIMNFL